MVDGLYFPRRISFPFPTIEDLFGEHASIGRSHEQDNKIVFGEKGVEAWSGQSAQSGDVLPVIFQFMVIERDDFSSHQAKFRRKGHEIKIMFLGETLNSLEK